MARQEGGLEVTNKEEREEVGGLEVVGRTEEELKEQEEEEGEIIAKRTRSKLPLNDTSISSIEGVCMHHWPCGEVSHDGSPSLPPAMLVPLDLEDPLTPIDLAEPMELEQEDLEWQKWLSDLFDPNSKSLLELYVS